MRKALGLGEREMEEIKAAVARAESKTTGEIALALAAESESYSFWELLASVCAAGIFFAVSTPFYGKALALYEGASWSARPWELCAIYGIAVFALIVAAFYVCNIPAIDRLVIPKVVRAAAVTHRAMRHFAESGVYDTESHSGVLVFVSYLEREVRIIADRGIAEKISQDLWDLIADEMASELKKGNGAPAFAGAVEKCSDLLARAFPARGKKANELPDGLVILEDSRWN